jgi:hypothetical protein
MTQKELILNVFKARPGRALSAELVQAHIRNEGNGYVPQPSIRRCFQQLHKENKLDLSYQFGRYLLPKEEEKPDAVQA